MIRFYHSVTGFCRARGQAHDRQTASGEFDDRIVNPAGVVKHNIQGYD
jgi:hypothetical protein